MVIVMVVSERKTKANKDQNYAILHVNYFQNLDLNMKQVTNTTIGISASESVTNEEAESPSVGKEKKRS